MILLGALLYATGPVTIGLVPTRAGSALARAWASAAVALLGLGVAWATLFAVGALLIGDCGHRRAADRRQQRPREPRRRAAAGCRRPREPVAVPEGRARGRRPVCGCSSPVCSFSAASEHRRPRRRPRAPRRTTGQSLREYGSRLGRAAGAAGGELALAGRAAGQSLAPAAPLATWVAAGLVGTAAGAAGRTAARVARRSGASLAPAPGAVAVRMARAGTASWQTKPQRLARTRPEARTAAAAAAGRQRDPPKPRRRGRPGPARGDNRQAGATPRRPARRDTRSTLRRHGQHLPTATAAAGRRPRRIRRIGPPAALGARRPARLARPRHGRLTQHRLDRPASRARSEAGAANRSPRAAPGRSATRKPPKGEGR